VLTQWQRRTRVSSAAPATLLPEPGAVTP